MRALIIGEGEIGRALKDVLQNTHEVFSFDKNADLNAWSKMGIDVMNICFPYSDAFRDEVLKYQTAIKPKYVVVHSTVPVGTCDDYDWVHSPVLGLHPHLYRSLTTFTKFLGGLRAGDVADFFRRAGMKVYIFDTARTTELMKLMDTTFYGLAIEFTKDVKDQCEGYDVPFEAWTLWTKNYNEGYYKLGYPEYQRPNLVPMMKKIGGHCVIPNCDLIDTKFTKFLKEHNEL